MKNYKKIASGILALSILSSGYSRCPELFADTDIEEVTRTYFKDYYGIDLNEEQLNKMYHPAREGADGL